jgi:hypothetical protein
LHTPGASAALPLPNVATLAAPFVNYRANIYALKELGADRIIAWSGPGAIDPSLRVGDVADDPEREVGRALCQPREPTT